MANHHTFPWHDAFLPALREMPVLLHAAQAVGIDRTTAWRHMEADPDFKAEVEAARRIQSWLDFEEEAA